MDPTGSRDEDAMAEGVPKGYRALVDVRNQKWLLMIVTAVYGRRGRIACVSRDDRGFTPHLRRRPRSCGHSCVPWGVV